MGRKEGRAPLTVAGAKRQLLGLAERDRQRAAAWIRQAPVAVTVGSLVVGLAVGLSRRLLLSLAQSAIVFLEQVGEARDEARGTPPGPRAASE